MKSGDLTGTMETAFRIGKALLSATGLTAARTLTLPDAAGTVALLTQLPAPQIRPSSAYPADTAGRLFPNFHAGAGGNAASHDEGLGVMASLSADATWEMRFPIPTVKPQGTMKLRLLALANATSGAAKLTVSDGTCAAGSSPSAVTLTAESQTTVTWSTGDNDKYKEAKITLSATPAGGDVLVVALKFQTSGWTLAQVSTWLVFLIWE